MLGKLVKATGLAAFVTAQRQEILGDTTTLPIAKSGNIYNDGLMGEALYKDAGSMALIAFIGWKTSNDRDSFPEYSWIQNWVQWEDKENPGQYLSATCNVGFDPRASAAETIVINNFYGAPIDSLNVRNGKWDSYGTPIPADIAPPQLLWQQVDRKEVGDAAWIESYKTSYDKGSSSEQLCTMWKPSWISTNGVPDVPELNEGYHQWMKEEGSIETKTGFRMWARAFQEDMLVNEDAGTFTFVAQDWSSEGVVPYVPPVPVDDDTSGGSGSGGSTSGSGSSSGSGSGSGSSSSGSGSGSSMDDKDADDMMEEAEEGGMMMIVIIIVVVAVVLILVVVIIFCVIRGQRNKKTPVELKEGGQQEMQVIDSEILE